MIVFHVSPHLWSPVLTIASQMECGVVEFHCDEVLFTSALVEICKSLEIRIQISPCICTICVFLFTSATIRETPMTDPMTTPTTPL